MEKKKLFGKVLSLVVVLFMLFGTVPQLAFAEGETENTGTVKVIVENDIWAAEDGADWTGKLIDEKEIQIDAGSTFLTVLKAALESDQKTMNDISSNTVSEINGIANGEAGTDCLWKGFVNDTDINQQFADYSVAKGNITNGSVIKVKYSGTVAEKTDVAGTEEDSDDGDVPLLGAAPQSGNKPTITTYVTISNKGVIASSGETIMSNVPVEVEADADGAATVDAVLAKAHVEYCSGGYSAPGGWVNMLWGINTGNVTFFVNGKGLSTGVTVDKVKNGDKLTASINKDDSYYADWYTSFDISEKTVKSDEEFTLTLTGFQGMAGGEPRAAKGVKIGTIEGGEFTQIGTKTTGTDGLVTLSFEKAGTYYVSASGAVKDMVADWSQPPYDGSIKVEADCPIIAPVCKVTVKEEITTYVTVSNKGNIAVGKDDRATKMINIPVTVATADGQATVDAVMQKLHEDYCPGGYSAPGGWVSKLWDVDTINTLFFINGTGLTAGVALDKVKDGDKITASINKDDAYYADWYTSFGEQEKEVEVNSKFTLTLTGFQGMAGGEPKVVAGVEVGIIGDEGFTPIDKKTTDDVGKVELSFDKTGTYYVSASGTVKDRVMDWSTATESEVDCPIIAPICKVTVTEEKYKSLWSKSNGAYLISSAKDLKIFRDSIGNGVTYEGKTVCLTNDIALTDTDDVGTAGIVPTDAEAKIFNGTFNGRGHTVSGWTNTEALFLTIGEKGSVNSLIMSGINKTNSNPGTAIAYYNSGVIEKCQVYGSITGNATGYAGYVSGNEGTIKNCLSSVKINSTKSDVNAKVSGFANSNSGTIENCVFAGQLSITEGKIYPISVGGLTNCWYLKSDTSSYKTVDGATACNSDQIKVAETFKGFDFVNTWELQEGSNNPILRYNFTEISPIVELKLIAKVGDYTYDRTVSQNDCVFPLTYKLEYTGSEPDINKNFDKILNDCGCIATLNQDKWKKDFAVTSTNDGVSKDFISKKLSDYYSLEYKNNDKYDFKIISYEFADSKGTYHDDKTISNTLTDIQKQAQVQKADKAIKTILDAIVKEDGIKAFKDPLFAFTCARTGYYPQGASKERMYTSLMTVWNEYVACQTQNNKEPETTETAKFVLALTAMGYDATDCNNINFIDELNKSDDSGKYFAVHYKAYALYSGRYGDYESIISSYVSSLTSTSKADSYSADDMATMYAQPIFLMYNPSATAADADAYKIKKYVEDEIIPWMSRSQNGYGLYKSAFISNSTNAWTDAQAQMLIGLLGVDFFSEDLVKNGNTMINYIIDNPELSLGYASDKSQCARALVSLLRSYNGKTNLFDCSDVTKVKGGLISGEIVKQMDKITAVKSATKSITKSVDAVLSSSVKEVKSKIDQILAPEDESKKLPDNMEEITDEQLNSVIEAYKAYQLLSDDERLLVDNYKDFKKILNEIGQVMHKDKKSGITISNAKWYQKVEVTEREFTDQELSKIKETFGEDAVILSGYDIHIIDLLTGKKAELKKSIRVKVPAADKDGHDSIAVLHIDEDGGYEFIKAIENDHSYDFDAQSFSPYAIIGFNGTWEDAMGSETEKSTSYWFWIALGAAALIAICIIVVMKRKDQTTK
ncbi:MAG: DUF4430 domain-containing protein [Clostridiales bacterium]|nr:DUF4430 domain-containing protein [Clostridiales bacterium]